MRACGAALGCAALLACTSSDDDDDDGAASGGAAADGSRASDGGVDGAVADCTVTPPSQCPDPPVHYGDVEPIFVERCVPCHDGTPGGPWGLLSYSHAASWYNEIQDVMLNCEMPPTDAGIAMTDGEREEILGWIRCGVPQ